jgi:hypothetical protein
MTARDQSWWARLVPSTELPEFDAIELSFEAGWVEGSKRRWGAPSMLELAVIQREYPDEFFYLPRPPVRAQKALFAALAVLGRARGYRAGRDQAQ